MPLNSLSRRGFLRVAALSSTGVALSGALPTARAHERAAALQATPLRKDLWLITGAGGNVVVQRSPEGALLVDGGEAARSADLLQLALRTAGATRLHTLFNTHWHPEQTGSNERAAKAGARIIAHENTRLWLTRRIVTDWLPAGYGPLPRAALPGESFYTTGSLDFGGDTLRYGHLGQAHTDGDLYVRFTNANVLVTGGVMSSAGWPLVDWQTGGWIGGLVAACDRLLKEADERTVVVPANGPPVGRQQLQEWRDICFRIFDRCVKQMASGKGPEECADTEPAKEFEARFGPSRGFVLAAFRSLWGHYAPDA